MPRAGIEMAAGELARRIGAEVVGDPEVVLRGAASLTGAGPEDLAFFAHKQYRDQLAGTEAAAVILPREALEGYSGTALVAANPYAAWAQALDLLFPPPQPKGGVHYTAILGEGVEVAPDARIDAHAVIEEGCRIGPRAWIEAGSVLGENCVVGADSRIGPNATVYADSELGERVRLHAGTVIGADGFGLAPDGEGYRKIPQVGRVVLEDDVEIGANSAVDRAALEETRIGRGTKIDDLVMIGHNCHIGKHCILSGLAGVAGSADVGDHCTIAAQAGVAGHLHVVGGTTIGAKAGVISDIDEPGVYAGFPHQPHSAWRREQAALRQVRSLRERLRALERVVMNDSEGES
jgi:UDP-3-O-[3-hydroxymyristoyl] glucosamine N-acyltransferase